MTTRNLLDYQGNVVGQLTLPDSTPEYVWQEKLQAAAKPPQAPALPDVTPRQLRQAIILSKIVTIEQIEAAMNGLPEPTRSLALVEWEYSIAFKRYNPLVLAVGQLLGWTSDQLDDLWRFAGSL